MKIYSGIEDTNGNIPWIDNQTGEQGSDKDGSRTLNIEYWRLTAQADSTSATIDDELAALFK
jgi:hypothetical protein